MRLAYQALIMQRKVVSIFLCLPLRNVTFLHDKVFLDLVWYDSFHKSRVKELPRVLKYNAQSLIDIVISVLLSYKLWIGN